jgi:hypothetical protein
MLNIPEPHGIPTMTFGFNGVPMHVESYDFLLLMNSQVFILHNEIFFPIKNKIYLISCVIIRLDFLSYLRYISCKNY